MFDLSFYKNVYKFNFDLPYREANLHLLTFLYYNRSPFSFDEFVHYIYNSKTSNYTLFIVEYVSKHLDLLSDPTFISVFGSYNDFNSFRDDAYKFSVELILSYFNYLSCSVQLLDNSIYFFGKENVTVFSLPSVLSYHYLKFELNNMLECCYITHNPSVVLFDYIHFAHLNGLTFDSFFRGLEHCKIVEWSTYLRDYMVANPDKFSKDDIFKLDNGEFSVDYFIKLFRLKDDNDGKEHHIVFSDDKKLSVYNTGKVFTYIFGL